MPLDYRNKMILAPMVRVGTLPMRLLALRYGADVVYTEEIVDVKMLECARVVNEAFDTVDFMVPGDTKPILRIHPNLEGEKVVFQMGTNNAERALKVALIVQDDVAGIDVNMGCPKPFSVHAGMGAALLDDPDNIEKILRTLVTGLSKPVTCKLRLLPSLDDTIKLAKRIEKCGVAALAIHGRTRHERPQHRNKNDEIREIARNLTIPVIANGVSGQVNSYEDIKLMLKETECSSVMLARAAMSNPSIFCNEGITPLNDIIIEYLKLCADFHTHPTNVKYVILRMLGDQQQSTKAGQQTLKVITLRQLCRVWGLEDYYIQARKKAAMHKILPVNPWGDEKPVTSVHISLPKKNFEGNISPRAMLNEWCKKSCIPKPTFTHIQRDNDKYFQSTISVESVNYRSLSWEKNKKRSEQAASMAALQILDLKHLLPAEYWDA